MAQSSYLTNLLGIDTQKIGDQRYEYTLPIFNELLQQGLNEDQIINYDEGFGVFKEFPYKAKPNPQQGYAQYEVVPQATMEQDSESDEEDTEVTIDYSSQTNETSDKNKDIVTNRYGTIRDNTPETLDVSIPLNQMSESELMQFGKNKGYVGEDGTLLGPQQFSTEGMLPGPLALGANMLSAPLQKLNDRQYDNYVRALQNKKMWWGFENKTYAMFSEAFKKANELSMSLNDKLRVTGSSGTVKIPGTFKKVNAIFDQFAPSGPDNTVVYHTSSGGHYNNDGKFVTGYGQTVAFGSMDDAIDTLQAAASSGDSSIVPDKFDGDWVAKMNNAKTLTQNQKNEINNAWQQIQSNNYNNNNNNNNTSVSSSNNYYRGNKSYGDVDDYTDNTSGI